MHENGLSVTNLKDLEKCAGRHGLTVAELVAAAARSAGERQNPVSHHARIVDTGKVPDFVRNLCASLDGRDVTLQPISRSRRS